MKFSPSKGFTLVETALVIIIGGVLMASMSAALTSYIRQAKVKTTNERIAIAHSALQQYLDINKKLPCPASLNAPLDDARFGREAAEDCFGSALAAGTFRAGAGDQRIRIGTLPVRSLNLSDNHIADGWHNRFIYAVTEKLATEGSFSQNGGSIAILDSNDNSVVYPDASAQYVLVSQGNSAQGAYSVSGGQAGTCDTTRLDGLNCNHGTTTFRKTLVTSDRSFDDVLYFQNATADETSIPAGAVLAFNLGACPTGWVPLGDAVGRVIVGSGNYSEAYTASGGRSWSHTHNYILGQKGGNASWQMNRDEMPAHDHAMPMGGNAFEQITTMASPFRAVHDNAATDTGKRTYQSGGNQPHENRQPYLALLYCVKA
ncbi:MAG: prepilin-type N-terminal cleavage/methylation domain-containing protein [Micavibrio sp.]